MAEQDGTRTRFLTVTEVAEMIRVSRMTVYRWVQNGDLPAVRVGRSVRVPEQAVDVFLQQSAAHPRWQTEDDDRSAGAVG